MLFRTLSALVLGMLCSTAIPAQEKTGYEITGRIKGLDEGEYAVMVLLKENGHSWSSVDSGIVRNGEFHIKGIVPEGPREYILQFNHHYEGKFKSIALSIDNGQHIKITCSEDINTLLATDFGARGFNNLVAMEGAPYTVAQFRLLPAFFLAEDIIGRLGYDAQKITDSIGFNGSLMSGIFESIKQAKISINEVLFSIKQSEQVPEFIRQYSYTLTNLFYTLKHPAFTADAYNDLSEDQKKGYYGQMLAKIAPLSIGQPFPEFTLPTADGKTLALRDVVAKSKITLVHFYAANSVIRERMQNELRQLYKIYHDKGLNVIGFYTDKYADQWKDIVQKENYPWYNVSDSKGKEGMAAKLYNEYIWPGQTIPNTTNVLIDAKGKILAWDVAGAELQWYLWKALDEGK
jgi:peroxiredoxin